MIEPVWEWRKQSGGWIDCRWFHACDAESRIACEPIIYVAASVEPPNEGSEFCPRCIEVVRADPLALDVDARIDGIRRRLREARAAQERHAGALERAGLPEQVAVVRADMLDRLGESPDRSTS